MAETPIPISIGNGTASIAGDLVSGNTYQQIKVVDGTIGGSTPLKVNADGSITASIVGLAPVALGGSTNASVITISAPVINQSVSGTVGASIIGLPPFALNLQSGPVGGGLVTSDGASSVFAVGTANYNLVFNGTTWDRQRGNASVGTLVMPYAFPASLVSGVTSVMTGTASVLVLPTPPVGQRNYITNVLVTNAAAVGTTVSLTDAGNIIYTGYAAASGGGFSASFPAPLRQTSVTGSLGTFSSIQASVYVSASGYTAP